MKLKVHVLVELFLGVTRVVSTPASSRLVWITTEGTENTEAETSEIMVLSYGPDGYRPPVENQSNEKINSHKDTKHTRVINHTQFVTLFKCLPFVHFCVFLWLIIFLER